MATLTGFLKKLIFIKIVVIGHGGHHQFSLSGACNIQGKEKVMACLCDGGVVTVHWFVEDDQPTVYTNIKHLNRLKHQTFRQTLASDT